MVAPFKGKRNEYQCPFCGRYASERNRYCSECFLVNPDQPGKPRSINVLMRPPHGNKPIAMVQLVATIVVGLLLVMGAFVIWDKYQPETIFPKKDEPAQTKQQTNEGSSYHKPPTPQDYEKVDNNKDAIPDEQEYQTDQKGTNTNDTPEAENSNKEDKAEDTSNKPLDQMGQEGTKGKWPFYNR